MTKVMTNIEKAKEIARLKRIDENTKYEHPFQLEVYERCLDMAEWKDKQFKEQRRIIRKHWQEWAEEQEQQLIDKACEWLKNNMYEGTCEQILSNKTYPFMSDFIEEFRKAMKGGDYDNK